MKEPQGHKVLIGHGVNMSKRTERVPIYLHDHHRKRGTLVLGTTGVGKTRTEELLITDDIESGKSVIVMDPKSDQRLFSKIYDVARRSGRLNELQLITPIYPQYSATIDPMAYYYDPEELIQHALSGIQGNDEFYGAASRLFVTPIVYGNLILAKAERRLSTVSLLQIYQGLSHSCLEDLKSALSSLPEDVAHEEATFYISMLQSNLAKPADYYEKICTTLQSSLVPLISGNIGKIIGKAESNKLIQRIEEGQRVIAVVHTGSMVSQSSAAILGRVLLSMIMATVGRHCNSAKEIMDPPLSLHIDEAAMVVTPDTLQILAMAGSANVMTHLYAQAVSQFTTALGSIDMTNSAMSNLNTKIFMKSPDAETAQYVVDHFGTQDVLVGMFSSNTVTTRQIEKDVLKKTDILDLQPCEAYMLNPMGRWSVVVEEVPEPSVKIVFPDAPGSRDVHLSGGATQP